MTGSQGREVSVPGTTMSNTVSEDEMDKLIERGSTPSLADLFRRGKENGLIKPGKEYGNG